MRSGVGITTLAVAFSMVFVARAGYEQPVRPGGVDGQEFWNEKAVQFVFAPAFGFSSVKGAYAYRYTVTDAKGGVHAFTNELPTAALTPVWNDIPENSRVSLTVEALGGQGEILAVAGRRSFWRMPTFHEGSYPKAKRNYAEAARKAYDYIFELPSTQYFLQHGKPDPAYGLNAYPSKMHAALVQAMVRYARIRPDRRDAALKLACSAADYLISVSQPSGTPLAGFPPTYDNPKAGPGLGGVGPMSQGKNMLLYPATVGKAYLALFRATSNVKYRAAAELIGRKYVELQGTDGTWTLKVDEKTGEPVNVNRAFPLGICDFLEELSSVVNDARYGEAVRRGLEFVRQRPMKDWNWEGQFEDVEPSAKYRNLTKHFVCDMAIFLLKRAPQTAETRIFARQAADFSEDQFVCWQTPCDERGEGPRAKGAWGTKYLGWHCPATLEQYECYVPIDASATKLIRMWRTIGLVYGNPLDLAKARAMADAVVNMQQENGRIPTFWMDAEIADPRSDWLNCMIATAGELDEMARLQVCEHASNADGYVPLFDGRTLAGWRVRGGSATYAVEEGEIVGRFDPAAKINTFLCTEREYENFIIKLDFKVISGNSGLQFRSAGRPWDKDPTKERIFGYQVEMCVDSDRTGRIYDEGGRGYQCGMIFLDNTPSNRLADAYSTFVKQGWNSLELQCVGPSIKTWINGRKVADILDDARGKGIFGLQIHCGKSGEARWRNIRIKELPPSQHWRKFFVNCKGAWKTDGTHFVLPENWSFVDEAGETVLKGVQTKDQKKDGLVITDSDYDNFAARVTWRISGGNSALYFRAAEENVPWTLKGFQNEIAGNEKDGALWHTQGKTTKGRGWVATNDELGAKARRKTGWNTVSTIAVGDRIVNRLNGFEMFDIVDPLCEKTGKLGLQLHGSSSTQMWFKDFEVQPISPEFVKLMQR